MAEAKTRISPGGPGRTERGEVLVEVVADLLGEVQHVLRVLLVDLREAREVVAPLDPPARRQVQDLALDPLLDPLQALDLDVPGRPRRLLLPRDGETGLLRLREGLRPGDRAVSDFTHPSTTFLFSS